MNSKILFFILSILIVCYSANGQVFRNLNFQELCDTSKTGVCYWDLSWGAKGSVIPARIDNKKGLLIECERTS